MFMSVVSKIIIQRTGWWASDGFLEYNMEVVENFIFGVSQTTIKIEHFHNIRQSQTEEDEDEKN